MDPELLRKMKIGCIGALTPIVINLLIVDLQTTLSAVTPISAFCYAVRVAALCTAACIVIYLNSDEDRPVKLFQLGIAAPALLTGMLNGAVIASKQSTPPQPNMQSTSSTPSHGSQNGNKNLFALEFFSLVSVAQAQRAEATVTVSDCTKPQSPTVTQQILKGLVGIVPDNQWLVVVGSYSNTTGAIDDANEQNIRFSGRFKTQVCAPLGGEDARYRVVLSEYNTYSDATKLKLAAITAGFPPDSWVWNPLQSAR